MADLTCTRAAADLVADDDTNTVVVQLAEYGTARPVNDGRGVYREAFDSLTLAERVPVKDSHNGAIIGHADTSSFRETPNPTVDLTIADTSAGRDLMALVRAGSIQDVSVEFNPKTGTTKEIGGVLHRALTRIHAIAFAPVGAHVAPVLAMREEDNTTMTEDTTSTPDLPADLVRSDQLDEAVTAIRNEITREFSVNRTAPAASPLAQFGSFGEAVKVAARDHDVADSLHRALADNLTTDNPGLIPEGWVTDVKGIIDRGRPTVNAFGTQLLPAKGMDVNFPYLDPALDLSTVVGEQVTQKTAITSVTVPILKGTAAIDTYAGGSDNSMQLVERSEPAYLDQLMRVYTAAMSIRMDVAAGAAFVAGSTDGPTSWVPATGTAPELRAALFEASSLVQAATGAPASFAVVSTDVWTAIGTLDGLYPAPYGTQNVAGTADAASLMVNVSGLPVIHGHNLGAGTFLVSNGQTAATMETGTRSIEAVNVELLGVDKAVYNMAAFPVFLPAGIIKVPTV